MYNYVACNDDHCIQALMLLVVRNGWIAYVPEVELELVPINLSLVTS